MTDLLSTKKPIAYQRGLTDFYGREFVINDNVLIPRPETEAIIDMVLNQLGRAYLPGVKPGVAKFAQDIKVVEVGTGSGCIAITLKLEIPELNIIATDLSKAALAVAKKNADRFGVKIEFKNMDLLNNFTDIPDLVIANLPYVNKEWDWIDKESLAYEPEMALYAGDSGLELIYKLINQVAELGVTSLILEADPCQHNDIVKYAKTKGYSLEEKRGFIVYLLG